jgi:hypothetical protein
MSITVVGLLEADLPGAIEYKDGGVGPLFRAARTEELIGLFEFLSRSIDALRKLGITDAISCYIDDVELFRDDDEGEANDFDLILRNAKETTAEGGGISFYLMLSHHDKQLSHVITFEASVDHPAEEAALSVLDTARLIDDDDRGEDEDDAEDDEESEEPDEGFASDSDKQEEEAEGSLAPLDDDLTFFDDRAAQAEDLVEAFLQRVLAALERELGVSEPEIDVWTDWEGAYGLEPTTMPGLPGITG